MSDELKDFRYYAGKAEAAIDKAVAYGIQYHEDHVYHTAVKAAELYAELAKAAPKTEATIPVRCPEWLSRDVRDLPRGFIDYQCVLFSGHGVEHESSTGKYWLTEVTE